MSVKDVMCPRTLATVFMAPLGTKIIEYAGQSNLVSIALYVV